LEKPGFDFKILFFFCDYLVSRKTTYLWNNFSFSFSFNVDIGVNQELALFSIFALYLSPILHIFEKQLKN